MLQPIRNMYVLSTLCAKSTLYNGVSVNVNWPLAKVPQEELPTVELYNALLQGDLPGGSLQGEVHINLMGRGRSTKGYLLTSHQISDQPRYQGGM